MKDFKIIKNKKILQHYHSYKIGILQLDIIWLNYKKVDIRISIRWGW